MGCWAERCWTASFLLCPIHNRRRSRTSPVLASASGWKSAVTLSTVIYKPFPPVHRDSIPSEEAWETCESITWSRPEANCAIRHTTDMSSQQGKGNSSLLLLWFSFSLKRDYKLTAGPLAAMPVGMLLKDKPCTGTPRFSWVVAAHISFSCKKQKKTPPIIQAGKQALHCNCCVPDTLTSAELRKAASNNSSDCRGNCCLGLLVRFPEWRLEGLKPAELHPQASRQREASSTPFSLTHPNAAIIPTSSHLPVSRRTASWHTESSS